MAVSGLAKAGVKSVVGYDKRAESGAHGVGTRYQNASWRAFDTAEKLLDEEAFNVLAAYRQRINVQYDDGSSEVVTSDRVQIILGSAIDSALGSAKRYGADLQFESSVETQANAEKSDIVAFFTGAHTSEIFPELKEEMGILSWPELKSDCMMWLRIQESEKTDNFCARAGEVGAEQWHYTIESARKTIEDVVRVRDGLSGQYEYNLRKLQRGDNIGMDENELAAKYETQLKQLNSVLAAVEEGKTPGDRFDYIFSNAPKNSHNLAKRDDLAKDGSVVLDGGYAVEVKIASHCSFQSEDLLEKFGTGLIVCGGDACVPPNPMAAYGATLACEAADMLVSLAVGYGHLNVILEDMEEMTQFVDEEWFDEIKELKSLLALYYEARGRSENYFQLVQTMICNLYSLPAFT
jgi:hypothetical protein